MIKLSQNMRRLRWAFLISLLPMFGLSNHAQDLASGLVANWNFDDNDFTDSIGIFDGEGQGSEDIVFEAGPNGFGQSITLDGEDQYVLIIGGEPDDLSMVDDGSISISAWFRVDAFDTDWQALVAQGEGSSWRIARRGAEAGIAYAGGIGDTPAGTDVNDGEWHHVVAITDAEGLDFATAVYIDGVQDTIIEGVPALASNGQYVRIGDNPGATGREWEGGIDDVAIWNRVLSEGEIASLYNDGAGTPIRSLFETGEDTIEILGVGAESLIGGDLTDPEDDGDEAAGPEDSSWNWVSIDSNIEPGFDGAELSFNIFDNAVGGGAAKWCCDDPTDDNPYWVAVQFGNPVALTHFTITSGNDTPDRDPIRFAIQGSNDGDNYADIFNFDEEESFFTERNQVALINLAEASEPYAYLRYIVYHTPGTLHQLNEIEYFGSFGGTGVPALAGTSRSPASFSVRVKDGADTNLDSDSVSFTVDGQTVAATLSKDLDVTTITYTPDSRFPALSAHTWELSAKDTAGNDVTGNGKWTTKLYGSLGGSAKVDPDTSKRGFIWEVHQNPTATANNNTRPVQQLNGELGENLADSFNPWFAIGEGVPRLPEVGYTGPITFEVEGVINFNQDDGGAAGEFTPDDGIPGIPGIDGGTDGVAGRITTFIELPAGEHTFIVNSDDGFFTTVGNPTDVFLSQLAGTFEGGRGAADTAFSIFVDEDGVYPVTTVWYEGGGGANIEFKTEKADGTRVLVNDTDNGGFTAYRAINGEFPAAINSVNPGIGAAGVAPNLNVTIVLTDGSTTVDANSVSVTLDGSDAGATASKSGDVTTVTVDRGGALWPAGKVVSASVTYTAGGSERTESWSWTVENYPTLSKGVTEPGTGEDAGFEFRIFQNEAARGNSTAAAEDQLAGTFDDGAENVADPSGGVESGDADRPGIIFNIDGVINFDQDGAVQGVFRDSGDGSSTDRIDGFIPGIPGLTDSTDNMAAEILTFIEFTNSGYHRMIFNSDDGFRVTEGHGAGDAAGVELGVFEGGRGATDSVFGFNVPQAGVYPIRAIWYEGGGGANLEWSSTMGDSRYLINDTDGNALKAFRNRTGDPIDLELAGSGEITSVALTGGNVVIEFTGSLMSAETVTGPYSPVAGAGSPYTVAPSKASEFYIAE